MKVAVVNTTQPFVRGGAEILSSAVVQKLNEFGHRAELVNIPYSWESPETVLRGIMASALLRVPRVERVIVHKFPSYYVSHENKVAWLFHQFRQVYDLWEGPHGFGKLPDNVPLRKHIRAMDVRQLRAMRRFTNSEVARDRLLRFNGLDATVLYPPLPDERGFACEEYGEYIFCPSRIAILKRQELLIRALGETQTKVGLHLAGTVEGGDEEVQRLLALARSLGVESRLKLEASFISEHRKKRLLAKCLAVAYIPVDEDSYGFVTLESFASLKAVIATYDSGGVLSVVRDGVSGIVTDPQAVAIAKAMDRLYEDRMLARRLGEGGPALLGSMNISWEHVIGQLTA